MKIIINILIVFIMLEHVYILYMEMFAWETLGKKAFKGLITDDLFKPTKPLAANQGLYNGFLAAGLGWTFFISDIIWQDNILIFFLSCIVLAGLYGGLTVSKKILITQSLPACIALILVLINR